MFDAVEEMFHGQGKNVTFLPLPPTDSMDRMVLSDGNHMGNVECKSRTVPSDRYPTLMVDALKWDAMIAEQQRSGRISYLFYAFSDGYIVQVRPAEVGPLPVGLSTPRTTAESLNATVQRPVVRVPRSRFATLLRMTSWPYKPTEVKPVGSQTRMRVPGEYELRRLVGQAWGGALVSMHAGYPVNHWFRTGRGTFGGWVDVRDVPEASTADSITVPRQRFFGALRQEQIFSNGSAWLVARCADGAVLMVQPSQVGAVGAGVGSVSGVYQEMVNVPMGAWARLAGSPF